MNVSRDLRGFLLAPAASMLAVSIFALFEDAFRFVFRWPVLGADPPGTTLFILGTAMAYAFGLVLGVPVVIAFNRAKVFSLRAYLTTGALFGACLSFLVLERGDPWSAAAYCLLLLVGWGATWFGAYWFIAVRGR